MWMCGLSMSTRNEIKVNFVLWWQGFNHLCVAAYQQCRGRCRGLTRMSAPGLLLAWVPSAVHSMFKIN